MSKNTLSDKTKSQDFDWPTSNEDHIKMEEWYHGEDISDWGSDAKKNKFWKDYRDDINRAYGNEDDYYDGKIVYIDTLSKEGISKQLKRIRGK